MEALQLREILASLMKEFEAAGVAADVSREHWRQVYESNALLREFSPSRIRIAEASISLPLALAEIAPPKARPVYLTGMQLVRLLPEALPLEDRQALADAAAAWLRRSRRISFASDKLAANVHRFVTERLGERASDPEVRQQLDTLAQRLERLRAEFVDRVNANPEREARFVYQAEELTKLDAGRLVRFEIKLTLD